MNQNGGIHKGGFAVLCHRNGGSESPGILIYTAPQFVCNRPYRTVQLVPFLFFSRICHVFFLSSFYFLSVVFQIYLHYIYRVVVLFSAPLRRLPEPALSTGTADGMAGTGIFYYTIIWGWFTNRK